MRFTVHRIVLCVGTSFAALGCNVAYAQSADEPPAARESNGEIVVTAQRRSENIQDVPVSVNAFGGDEIANRRIETINDLAAQAPGLRVNDFNSVGNISLRGIGTAFVSGNGESSVAVYLDGIFIPAAKGLTMGQFDLGGIEVLRGPQGTLYGRNSTAGVINMSSARPTRDRSAGFSVGIGNYEQFKSTGYISGPLGDRVAVRIYGERDLRQKGYVKNINTGQELDDLDAYGARFSLDAEPSNTWTMALRLTRRVQKSAGPTFDSFDPAFPILSSFGLPVALTQPAFDPYELNSPTFYKGRRELNVGSLKNSLKITEGITLNSVTGMTQSRFSNFYDTLGTALTYPIDALNRSKSFSQEINLTGESAAVDWLIGAYYFRQKYSLRSTSNPPAGLGPLSTQTQDAVQKSVSGFADATIHLGQSTHVFGGARISRETVRQTLFINDYLTPLGLNGPATLRCPPNPALLDQTLGDTHVTGRLGVRQQVGADVNVYVQASHGYKGPGFSQSSCQNQFKPETVNALEAGLKSQFWGGRVTFNSAFFYNDVKNLQLEIVSPLGVPVVNVPKAEIYGAEFQLAVNPVDALRIDANLSLLHARYTESFLGDPLLDPALTPQDIKGHRLNNAPDVSGYLGIEYEIGLGRAGTLTPRGEMTATSDYNLREVNYPWTIQDGYVNGNAYVTWRDNSETLFVRGWIKNIADKAILGGVLGFGGATGSFAPPRTYGIEIGANF